MPINPEPEPTIKDGVLDATKGVTDLLARNSNCIAVLLLGIILGYVIGVF